MSLDDEMIYKQEQVKRALCATDAIKYCHCGTFYWTLNNNPYALVFSFLQKNGIEIDGSFVKKEAKNILDAGGDSDDSCPYCGWR